ncbi:hypothetical protein FE257_005607 [Aspergillus nanangensis]|uniref:Uncharacterized protein n=1 Tax=Aspergillus nanangensis TaxID=2582783 RepID=A0AAD4GVG0_ASPNN|nr:hypothetical protein FE257_005607 [Aspergillus nanangensis]
MATTHLPACTIPSALPTNEEVQEYEKILKISDDIFSGAHPRLKVPQQFVRKPASRNAPTAIQVTPGAGPSEFSLGNPNPPSSTSSTNIPSRVATSKISQTDGPPPATGPSRIIPKHTSEIDPIFLTKSDDLVRAELQLHRQRVERVLREQLEQKRQESRQKASVQDTKPDFDVSEVLNKALEMVKPSSSTGESSESVDDNSFYSSRAPDSPQHGDPAPPSNAEDLAPEVPIENYSDELHRLEALNRTESDQDMQNTYPVADHRLPYHQRRSRHVALDQESSDYYEPQLPPDTVEEPEYSPPEPGVAPMERDDGFGVQRGYPSAPRRRTFEARPPDRPHYSQGLVPVGDDVRIIRNHITSPAAPQPSRVSPLATAKVPSVRQPKERRPEYDSEEAVPQHVMSRKRRRVHEERDRVRPASYRMQGTGPDDPYIKEEPVSPPPFSDAAPTYSTRQPQERPVYIDIVSPRYTPVIERREPPLREHLYDLFEYSGEPEVTRSVSRLDPRRPGRDHQDLRRVASIRQVQQSEYPREFIEQTSPHSMRAGSYAIAERPPQERARYYDELAPITTRRYIPAGESPTSPRYRETYYEEEVPSRMMAPPPRRIVVDEHGNQYYETVATPRVQMMPPPSSRVPVPRSEVYDDHPQIRHASVRPASVMEDPYGNRRYVQEAPPQEAYRRVPEGYARPVPSEILPYAAPLEEPYPRSSSVQVTEYPTRRPAYVEEADLPRERIVRIPSVRPPTSSRYEEPRDIIQRVASVRPGGREVSVYLDDDARRPREYIERPVYMAPRQIPREDQYYPGGEAERMVLDGGVRRLSQRYG